MQLLGIPLDCDEYLKTYFGGEQPNHQLVESMERLPSIQRPTQSGPTPPPLSFEQVQEYIDCFVQLPIERTVPRNFLLTRDGSFSDVIVGVRMAARAIFVQFKGNSHPLPETIRAFRAVCRIQATLARSPSTLPRICEYMTLNYAASFFAALMAHSQIDRESYQKIRLAVDELLIQNSLDEMLIGEIGITYFRRFTQFPKEEYIECVKILPPTRKLSKLHFSMFLKCYAPMLAAPIEIGYLHRSLRALQSLRDRKSDFGLTDLIKAFEPIENPLSLYKGLSNDRDTFVGLFQAYETEGLRSLVKQWMVLTLDRLEGMSYGNSALNAEHAEILISQHESVLKIKSYRVNAKSHRVQLPDWR